MALQFDEGSTDNVSLGSDSSIDNLSAFTYIVWSKLRTAITGGGKSIMGIGTFGGQHRKNILYNLNTAQSLAFSIDRATTDASANTDTAQYTVGEWTYIAATFDTTVGPSVYVGDLNTIVAEVSGYLAQETGEGAIGDSSGSTFTIGATTGASLAPQADIAVVMIFNKVLTLAELKMQQFRPHMTGDCVFFSHLGFNGTGTQPDWSGTGNNSVSVTGVAVADHVPLGAPFGFDEYMTLVGRTTKNTDAYPLGVNVGMSWRMPSNFL